MKQGKEVDIKPLSGFVSKGSNKELDKIVHDINDKLYFFSTLYINNKVRDYLLKEIEDAGNKTKNVNVPRDSKQAERKAELITKLRDAYTGIRKYFDDDSIETNIEQEKKMSSYLVAKYLKDKKETEMSVDQKLEWIKNIKMFRDFYPISLSLQNVQNELLKEFVVYSSF